MHDDRKLHLRLHKALQGNHDLIVLNGHGGRNSSHALALLAVQHERLNRDAGVSAAKSFGQVECTQAERVRLAKSFAVADVVAQEIHSGHECGLEFCPGCAPDPQILPIQAHAAFKRELQEKPSLRLSASNTDEWYKSKQV